MSWNFEVTILGILMVVWWDNRGFTINILDIPWSSMIIHYPLVMSKQLLKPWPFNSWIYPLKMVTFHSYVSLPEGIFYHHNYLVNLRWEETNPLALDGINGIIYIHQLRICIFFAGYLRLALFGGWNFEVTVIGFNRDNHGIEWDFDGCFYGLRVIIMGY